MVNFLKNSKSTLFCIACLLLMLSLVTFSVVAQAPEPEKSEREVSETDILNGSAETSNNDPNATLYPLYHFSGVLNNAGSWGTAIICTNIDPVNSTLIEVRLYQFNGNLIDTATILADHHRSVTFESTSISFYVADSLMHSDPIEQGYGLILTEHKNVICTVQVLDPINNPPAWMETLPVYSQAECGSFLPFILK